METMQRRRQIAPQLVPGNGSSGSSEREALRRAADAVADAADRAMHNALAATETMMRSMQQQSGE
jgi:hypothetical protein